jgi:hypothetical protein
MTTKPPPSYDVLLLESAPHAGDTAAERLTAGGHRVHRCYATPDSTRCAALEDRGRCPVDGHIDVAVLVRRSLAPVPTRRESGVACVRRAGIPVVQEGPQAQGPGEPWITAYVRPGDPTLAAATAAAVQTADEPAVQAIRKTISPLLHAAGIDEQEVACTLDRSGTGLAVHVTLPEPASGPLRGAIGVRVLDALRSAAARTSGDVDVYVHPEGA